MTDYINRVELLKEEQIFQQYNSAIKDDEYIRAVTVADIKAMPSADVVEVIRCKDCKHCDKAWGWCNRMSEIEDGTGTLLFVEPTDYCKWGEKE